MYLDSLPSQSLAFISRFFFALDSFMRCVFGSTKNQRKSERSFDATIGASACINPGPYFSYLTRIELYLETTALISTSPNSEFCLNLPQPSPTSNCDSTWIRISLGSANTMADRYSFSLTTFNPRYAHISLACL